MDIGIFHRNKYSKIHVKRTIEKIKSKRDEGPNRLYIYTWFWQPTEREHSTEVSEEAYRINYANEPTRLARRKIAVRRVGFWTAILRDSGALRWGLSRKAERVLGARERGLE